MQELVSQAQFARLRRVSQKTVTAWKARGLLVRIGNKIHVEATNRILDARPAIYRGGSTSRRNSVEEPAAETAPLPENFENWTTAKATRKKEICLALMRQHQLDVVRGKYLAVTDVQRHWSHIVIAVRGAMMALPTNARMRLQLTAEQTLGLEKLMAVCCRRTVASSCCERSSNGNRGFVTFAGFTCQ